MNTTPARVDQRISPRPDDIILSVQGLSVCFFTNRGIGQAVNGVSFDLRRGETLGLVGESGCGKSATVLSIVGLQSRASARITQGKVMFCGNDLVQMSARELRKYRGKHIAMVLQDPMTALNPVYTIGNQLLETLRLHLRLKRSALRKKAIDLLGMLRIPAARECLGNYPYQFSGGMRQRIVGAIAIAGSPEVLIADEPTTSLDATIEAAYLALLKDIQQETGLAIIYISHDLGVVARISDRIAVMYAGKIVESASSSELFTQPAHPYTDALLKALPDVRERPQRLVSIEGQPPSIYDLLPGCAFAARCPQVMDMCREAYPPTIALTATHSVACWRHT